MWKAYREAAVHFGLPCQLKRAFEFMTMIQNTFGINIIPPDDSARVAALERYRLLDTPAEQIFDNMTLLAATIFRTKISLISLVGAETVFFKSAVGTGNVRCTGRGESLCALAILSPDVLVFENTPDAPEIAASPAVKAGVRFYAGAPLKTPDGYPSARSALPILNGEASARMTGRCCRSWRGWSCSKLNCGLRP